MEKIKEIVSGFIKVPPEQIGPATPIDRSAVRSSILLHRMYARLAGEGIRVTDYNAIKVFGDLWKGESPPSNGHTTFNEPSPAPPATPAAAGSPGIGIDIQDIASLPKTADFRKDEFYRMNFSPEETAYCILQPDPYASFAGLFAVKEAIVKAGGHPGVGTFDSIRIGRSPEGKPLHPEFAISISHSAGLAVAVAVRSADILYSNRREPPVIAPVTAKSRVSGVAWLALLLALAALSVALIHRI